MTFQPVQRRQHYRFAILCLGIIIIFTPGAFASARFFHTSPILEEIRIGDYVKYTQIALETSSTVPSCEIVPLTQSSPVLLVKLYDVKTDEFGKEHQYESVAFRKITFSYDSKNNLVLTIPLSDNVDMANIHPCIWDSLVTIDLPLKKPNTTNIPPLEKILAFKNNGGKVVIIDPGHGGFNTGAVGGNYTQSPRLVEKNVALDVAMRLKQYLSKDKQILPILTRYGDYLPAPFGAEGKNRNDYYKYVSLPYRVQLAKECLGDVYISIHLNAIAQRSRQKSIRGFEIWYLGDQHANDLINNENLDSEELNNLGVETNGKDSFFINALIRDNVVQYSKLLAGTITQEMKDVPRLILRDPPMKPNRFVVLKQLNMPSVLVELSFLTNPIDHEIVRNQRDRFAKALYLATRKYFFDTKEPPAGALLAQAPEKKAAEPPQPIPTPIIAPIITQKTSTPTPPPAPIQEAFIYVHEVQAGETLFTIAQAYEVSLDDLRNLNKDKIGKRDLLQIGQELILPPGAKVKLAEEPQPTPSAEPEAARVAQAAPPKEEKPATASTPPPKKESEAKADTQKTLIYEVQPRDTLEKIAIAFNTSVASLRSLNQIENSLIHPGEKLQVIPGEKSETLLVSARPTTYKVQRGDTLSDIAKRFSVSVTQLKRANGLRNNRIDMGDVLQIP